MIIVHDIINVILIIILSIQIHRYMNVINVEKMDMSLFAVDSNYNPNLKTDTSVKTKLEELELKLLKERYNMVYDFLKERDASVVNDKLVAPERRLEINQYANPNLKLNISTHGEIEPYQLVGILYNKELNKNYQLFGRRTYPLSPEWEYYIVGKDSDNFETKFPLSIKTDVYQLDGTEINIPIYNSMFKVLIYNYNQPRYSPFILN